MLAAVTTAEEMTHQSFAVFPVLSVFFEGSKMYLPMFFPMADKASVLMSAKHMIKTAGETKET